MVCFDLIYTWCFPDRGKRGRWLFLPLSSGYISLGGGTGSISSVASGW